MDSSRADAAARPRPASAVHVVFGLILLILTITAVFVVGNYAPYQQASGFVALCLILLPLLVTALWGLVSWLRARRRPRALDAALPLCAAVTAGAALILVDMLAYAHGIKSSALPRLSYGTPLPADLPYVIAAAICLAALAAIGLWLLCLVLAAVTGRGVPAGARDQRSTQDQGEGS